MIFSRGPIKCYQCESLSQPDCESSDRAKLSSFVQLCPLLSEGTFAGMEPIACRKILQVCFAIIRTIRECAYSGDKNLNGLRKQGNKAIKLFYYQCENAVDAKVLNIIFFR
ncbi:unnamed protein product [Dracunculus medinensis]|uniref:Saposin B-type domain-containing protein n=1 Tax=Dracunculus medinensis TaxID=318479 RepID=A0A0N4UAD7_DRAME|nr:unnamed protein product [Dracunculus medinensis]